jgi:hypothetical protein
MWRPLLSNQIRHYCHRGNLSLVADNSFAFFQKGCHIRHVACGRSRKKRRRAGQNSPSSDSCRVDFVYDTIRIMVLRIKSRISSMAASGKRASDGMSATASSTSVSVATKFMSDATSDPCSVNSSPSSVSLRKVCSALRENKYEWAQERARLRMPTID